MRMDHFGYHSVSFFDTVHLIVIPLFLFVGKLKKQKQNLPCVAQWIECQPVNQRVTGSIPSQGTCLGCGPGPG